MPVHPYCKALVAHPVQLGYGPLPIPMLQVQLFLQLLQEPTGALTTVDAVLRLSKPYTTVLTKAQPAAL